MEYVVKFGNSCRATLDFISNKSNKSEINFSFIFQLTMNLSIDFFIRILSLTFFHPSFVLILLPFIYTQGYVLGTPEFFWVSLYTGTVCFFWLLGYISSKSRNGWKTTKTDWDDEVVVVTGGSGGVGGLLAETLAFRNVTVIVLDIEPPRINGTLLSLARIITIILKFKAFSTFN